MTRPALLVIAGPNGAGKTTRREELLDAREGIAFGVDARLCARTQDGMLRKVYGPLPHGVDAAVAPLPHHADLVDLRGSAPGA